jgi:hypothetical protein
MPVFSRLPLEGATYADADRDEFTICIAEKLNSHDVGGIGCPEDLNRQFGLRLSRPLERVLATSLCTEGGRIR